MTKVESLEAQFEALKVVTVLLLRSTPELWLAEIRARAQQVRDMHEGRLAYSQMTDEQIDEYHQTLDAILQTPGG
jgi:hypothetical protein